MASLSARRFGKPRARVSRLQVQRRSISSALAQAVAPRQHGTVITQTTTVNFSAVMTGNLGAPSEGNKMPGESVEEFLAREAAEHQRRLQLTEELGLRRLGYIPEAELAPADQATVSGEPPPPN
jgi:hypothetical protein